MEKVKVDIEPAGTEYTFIARGQIVKFPGFIKVYTEGKDDEEDGQEEAHAEDKILPKMEEGDGLDLDKLDPTQHFTKPPPRYTEASLVKKLESEGIGRPSTYAPTISTVMNRGYIEKEAKLLKPTDLAMVVTDVLIEHFANIVDYKFTAEMEDKLDQVEAGKVEWVPMIREFYGPFHKTIEEKEKTLKKEDIVNEESEEICDKCEAAMVIKLGRFGKFLSCSKYPDCKNAKPLDGETNKPAEDSDEVKKYKEKYKDKKCEECGAPVEVKSGRYGPFVGCSDYPKCKFIKSIVVLSGVNCPNCKGGQLAERRTKKGGKVFWGCNKFPKCKTASWHKPVEVVDGKLKVENKDGEVVFLDDISKKKKE